MTREILTEVEQTELKLCEGAITKGLNTFVEVGLALTTIRDKKLYRSTHGTFEDYCQEKWSITRRRAYQLMESAEVASGLCKNLHTPEIKESHAAELAKIPTEKREEVLQKAAGVTDGKVTAKAIREAGEASAGEVPVPSSPVEPPSNVISYDASKALQKLEHVLDELKAHAVDLLPFQREGLPKMLWKAADDFDRLFSEHKEAK